MGLRTHAPPCGLGDRRDQREPQTCARGTGARGIRAAEALEGLGDELDRKTGPVVGDRQHQLAVIGGGGQHRPAGPCLGAVAQQVAQHLLEPVWIADQV